MGVFEADVVEFFAGDVVVEVVVVGLGGARGGGGGQLDEFAVRFGLDDAVDVDVGAVVPYSLGGHVHGEGVLGLRVVGEGVGGVVAATAYVSTDETDPEVGVCVADAALG